MADKIPCTSCNAMVLPTTAEKFDGLCARCANLIENPPSALPSAIAFRIAAGILILNAAAMAYVDFVTEAWSARSLSILIDVVLAALLLQGHEGARLLTQFRAVLGLVVAAVPLVIDGALRHEWTTLILVGTYAGGLMVVLSGETTKPKLWLGGLCLAAVALMTGVVLTGVGA